MFEYSHHKIIKKEDMSTPPPKYDAIFKKSEKEKNIYTVRTKLPKLQAPLFNKGKKERRAK